MAEHDLDALVVDARLEAESAALLRSIDGPPGERPRDFGDILLRVAAIDAERVQLQQLAPIVLVEPARRLLGRRLAPAAGATAARRPGRRARRLGVRPRRIGAHPVVEIEEHRRTLRRRPEQLSEVAEHMRPDRVALVLGQEEPRRSLPARRR